MKESKKVMQINCFFRSGSTGRIVGALHDGLRARGVESVVCYARRPMREEAGVFRVSNGWEQKLRAILTRLFGDDAGRGGWGTRQILSILRRECPDVVHLHVLNGHFVHIHRLLGELGRMGIPVVLTLHAEQPYTAGCDHAHDCNRYESECHDCPRVAGKLSRLWRDDARRAFRRMQKALSAVESLSVVGVSPWVTERASRAALLAGRPLHTVLNGVNTAAFRPRPSLSAHLRRRWGIGAEEVVLLHVTPRLDHPIKGGRSVFEVFERVWERVPSARLLIVGWDGDRRRLPVDYVPSAAVLARTVAVPHTTDTHALAGFYTMASVTLLTGRRETFSMVCAESLCCGTPVAGFAAGGPESIALSAYSRFVPQGDIEALSDAVTELVWRRWDRAVMTAEAAEAYDAARMVEGYLEVYGLATATPAPEVMPQGVGR